MTRDEFLKRFKVIPRYPDYLANKNGQIYSLVKNRLLNPSNRGKYYSVELRIKKGIYKKESVHTLILETFVGSRPNNFCCNHKNGNKLDNRVENLEWCSNSQNLKHAYNFGLKYSTDKHKAAMRKVGKKQGKILARWAKNNRLVVSKYVSKLNKQEVDFIFRLKSQGVMQKEIAKKFNISQSTISNLLKNKSYRWYFHELNSSNGP